MKSVQTFLGKNILVLGLAKSGLAAAKLLHKLGANVIVNDTKPYEENQAAKELEQLGISVICGHHPEDLLSSQNIEYIVKNPGILYSNIIIQQAEQMKLPIVTEIELAYAISEADIIAITGSNGKTTTTTLIYEMLKEDGQNPLIAGNIGNVACEVVQQATEENVIVMELSSFQLLGTLNFKPKIALLLNIFDAHLDYHGTKEEYMRAKQRIFLNQLENDYSVINANDENVKQLAKISKGKKVSFSTSSAHVNGAYMKDNQVFYQSESIIPIKEIVLPGEHSLENILAAVTVAKLRGVRNESIRKVLKTFSGVKHRLQYVGTIKGRLFFNDSKATNILATSKALSAFQQPTILLAGGLDRGNEFDELKSYMKNVKAVITFGQTAPKIERIATEIGIEQIKRVDNVEQAAFYAYEISEEHDVILLSPACASWDQYKTFEERGDIFIDAVHKLK
ncbi:UDP-N-acetylmuramoyl-L-alanine--D-glutamate ligase [Bacillus sp. FJAT-47783]|uniref:UDP-N-acetylmuramoyl-L-alanine--D-glutamate ligase n=1 Tax=Bacillus sp. FJAT-47783 TaxID=2922712 RepID=UPI001FAE3421|nr:UDP-N-acetylmuramoyl-L-alanine--D-glutamate ligase [Bacillus sp. FJAT-47783]